jgi:hypothetical protein
LLEFKCQRLGLDAQLNKVRETRIRIQLIGATLIKDLKSTLISLGQFIVPAAFFIAYCIDCIGPTSTYCYNLGFWGTNIHSYGAVLTGVRDGSEAEEVPVAVATVSTPVSGLEPTATTTVLAPVSDEGRLALDSDAMMLDPIASAFNTEEVVVATDEGVIMIVSVAVDVDVKAVESVEEMAVSGPTTWTFNSALEVEVVAGAVVDVVGEAGKGDVVALALSIPAAVTGAPPDAVVSEDGAIALEASSEVETSWTPMVCTVVCVVVAVVVTV